MTRKQMYIGLLVFFLAFTAYEEIWLRPYLIHHHIHTFYIAGSLPNLLAVVVCFLLWNLVKYPLDKADGLKAAGLCTAAMVAYELAQPFMDNRTFDVADIAASILGGLLCAGIAWLLQRMPGNKN